MVSVVLKFCGDVIFDGAFNSIHVFAGRNSGAVAHTKNMRIDGLSRVMPPHVQDNVGGFPTNARKRLKGGTGRRDFAIEFIDQKLGHFHDVFCLVAEQADGFDVFDQFFFAKVQHFLWRVRNLEKRFRCLVYAEVSGLGRKCDGHSQGIGIGMVQFALGFRFSRLERLKNLDDCRIGELFSHKRVLADCDLIGKGEAVAWAKAAVFGFFVDALTGFPQETGRLPVGHILRLGSRPEE